MFRNDENIEKKILKLKLNLKLAKTGFVLIKVNDIYMREQITDTIKLQFESIVEYKLTPYNLKEVFYKLCDFETEHVNSYALFYMPEKSEEVDGIIRQFNVMRNVFAEIKTILIFFVPAYVDLHIAEYMPDLYDYFILKQDYCYCYDNIIDILLPQNKHLITKEERSFEKDYYKKNFNNRKTTGKEKKEHEKLENIYRELESLSNTKKNPKVIREYLELRIAPVIKNLEENENFEKIEKSRVSVSKRECVKIFFKTSRMLQRQKMYDEAGKCLQLAGGLIENTPLESILHVEVIKEMANNAYYNSNYKLAEELYQKLYMELLEQNEETYMKCFLCSCMAACRFKQEDTEGALSRILEAIRIEKQLKENTEGIYFVNAYNYLLILLKNREERIESISDEYKEKLFARKFGVVEQAMLMTLYAWIQGVVLGKKDIGLEYALKGLELKRKYFMENDIRIAESHYGISVLYLLKGNLERAEKCCQKCLNILKNHFRSNEKIKITNDLKEEILSRNK